jgi:predicted Zn-dependent protease
MSGGTTTIDEMIATTKRGFRVTRFSNVGVLDPNSLLCSGYTRDGLWLIENGKISKPVKNFRFTESPLFMLNNVDALGVPQRVFHPSAPAIVPPIKARDFSFTSLSEAI